MLLTPPHTHLVLLGDSNYDSLSDPKQTQTQTKPTAPWEEGRVKDERLTHSQLVFMGDNSNLHKQLALNTFSQSPILRSYTQSCVCRVEVNPQDWEP